MQTTLPPAPFACYRSMSGSANLLGVYRAGAMDAPALGGPIRTGKLLNRCARDHLPIGAPQMARLILATALLLAVLSCATRSARTEETPWCAVITLGMGDAYWDCQYRSLEECIPQVLAGNRGFCNPNPRFRALTPRQRKHRW